MRKVLIFLCFSICIFSGNVQAESEFINVGNLKIVRAQDIRLKEETINIKLLDDNSISIKTSYFFDNLDARDIKETYIFHLDQIIDNGKAENYIDDIQFIVGKKKLKNLRAVIKFDENGNKIQREWFGVAGKIGSIDYLTIEVSYIIKNINKKEFKYNFDIKNNFLDNSAEILKIKVDKGNKDIEHLEYKGYSFNENEDGSYYLNAAEVYLDNSFIMKWN